MREVRGAKHADDVIYELRVTHDAVQKGGWFRFPSSLQVFMAAAVATNDERHGHGGILQQALEAVFYAAASGASLDEACEAGWRAQRGNHPTPLHALEERA